VSALTCTGSDHTQLLIDSRDSAHLGNKNHFSFELSWMRRDGFYEMAKDEWNVVALVTLLFKLGKIKSDILDNS
jgi:hypothetical protein